MLDEYKDMDETVAEMRKFSERLRLNDAEVSALLIIPYIFCYPILRVKFIVCRPDTWHTRS